MTVKKHKLFSLLLALALSFLTILPVSATQEETNELTISSVEDFLVFTENCRLDSFSRNLSVSLEANIDLTDTNFQGIPIFCGTFNGNGYTVSGIHIQAAGSYMGLFRYLSETACVTDLKLSGTVTPTGSAAYVGSFAGSNSGKIENCSFEGTVAGTDHVGGIAGISTSTGTITQCSAEGSVIGNHFVGGITGTNQGIIETCKNYSDVNTETQHNEVNLSDITIENLTGSESAATATDIGGIAGTSSGYIHGCENHADVGYPHIGYNIGGIAGSQIGYLSDCKNYATVSGRKEIGGITGQLEPAVAFTYSADTLQLLSTHLNTLSSLSTRISRNLGATASGIQEQIVLIQGHINNATGILTRLIPGSDPEYTPDIDTMTQGVKELSAELSAVSKNLSSILSLSTNVSNTLAQDLRSMSATIESMQQIIGSASENLGGNISDASDDDTDDDSTAKIDSCQNYGPVHADLNGGGITGAICFESDLDPEADIMLIGELSLNFSGAYRAVIVNCDNSAHISVKKQYGGGITGLATLGLIRSCTNTGALNCDGASYVGGIAGYSDGYIRSCNAKSQISAKKAAGGIAGYACTVSDCLTIADCEANENIGGILGLAEDLSLLTVNRYMILQQDIGAVDGISYDNAAQGITQADFLAMDNLPDIFKELNVTFILTDGSEHKVTLQTGQTLSDDKIPSLPAQEGYQSSWTIPDGPLYFNTVISAEHIANRQTIQSALLRDNGMPVVLAEGSFKETDTVELTKTDNDVAESAIETWQYTCNYAPDAIHYLPPADVSPDQISVLLCSAAGQWYETSHRISGSYVVFSPAKTDTAFCIIPAEASPLPYILTACCAAIVIAAVVIPVAVHKRKKKTLPNEQNSL